MKRQKKIRYALVGAGHIAQAAMLPAFQHASENSELVAIVSGDPVKRSELSQRYGVEYTGSYGQLEDVLADAEADAVYLAVPNELHREFTERCANVKVHVLCEKPMAVTEEDCRAMISATHRAGVALMIAYRLHFDRGTLEALEIAHSGQLGEIRYFGSLFSHQVRPGNIRTRSALGGGALFDLGPYPINAARHLFASEPIEVSAFQVVGRQERVKEVDELTTAILRFSQQRTAQLTVSQGAAEISNYRVVGTKGDLRVEPGFEYVDPITHHLTVEGRTTRRTFPRTDQFAPELIHFSRSVLRDEEPEPSGEEGLADVRVMQAILKSAQIGRAIPLAPFKRSQRPRLELAISKPPVRKQATVHASPPGLH